MVSMESQVTWTLDQLHQELQRFEQDALRAGRRENSVNTYVQRSSIFLRWLGGDYQFQGAQH